MRTVKFISANGKEFSLPRNQLLILMEKNPLMEICGSICHHPCEQDCNYLLKDRYCHRYKI